jgi:hypothetical protein
MSVGIPRGMAYANAGRLLFTLGVASIHQAEPYYPRLANATVAAHEFETTLPKANDSNITSQVLGPIPIDG